LQDSRRSQSPEDNSGLEYVDNAKTDVGIPIVESEVYETTSTTDGREDVVANIAETTEHAPANVVGEASSNEDNQDYSATGSTPRSELPHTPEIIAEPKEEDTEDVVTQNADLVESRTEYSDSDAHHPDDDFHQLSYPYLAGEHEVVPSEEHIEAVEDPDNTGSETWDLEFGDDELEGAWTYEADQDEGQQEEQDSTSAESSVTLSSSRLSSKRSFHELDDNENESPNHSPGPKKLRTE